MVFFFAIACLMLAFLFVDVSSGKRKTKVMKIEFLIFLLSGLIGLIMFLV